MIIVIILRVSCGTSRLKRRGTETSGGNERRLECWNAPEVVDWDVDGLLYWRVLGLGGVRGLGLKGRW